MPVWNLEIIVTLNVYHANKKKVACSRIYTNCSTHLSWHNFQSTYKCIAYITDLKQYPTSPLIYSKLLFLWRSQPQCSYIYSWLKISVEQSFIYFFTQLTHFCLWCLLKGWNLVAFIPKFLIFCIFSPLDNGFFKYFLLGQFTFLFYHSSFYSDHFCDILEVSFCIFLSCQWCQFLYSLFYDHCLTWNFQCYLPIIQ